MRIDKGISEKERYNLLRNIGYTPTEARKYRRYGGKKFLEKIEEKNVTEYAKTFNKLANLEKKEDIKILPDFKLPEETKSKYNYKNKYNYVIKTITGDNKVEYFTYTTNQKLKDKEVKDEIGNYIKTANRLYKRKIKNYYVESLEVTK